MLDKNEQSAINMLQYTIDYCNLALENSSEISENIHLFSQHIKYNSKQMLQAIQLHNDGDIESYELTLIKCNNLYEKAKSFEEDYVNKFLM